MGGERTVIICRCNDVTLDQIIKAINEGVDDFEVLRKYLKIGFGPCQGRSCLIIAARIFAKLTNKSIEEALGNYHVRPPIIPIPAKFFIKGEEQ
ncbi:MAG: (2Fe-2S)-binding protein [Desulfurococcaceae archaeon]